MNKREKNILRDQSGLSQDGKENSEVQCSSPEPMAGIQTISLFEVSPEQDNGEPIQDLEKWLN
jgi:hypothetical protein